MREIKFRAWDEVANRIIEWQELLDYGSGLAEYLENPEDTELVFQQYTGLKDKNGKEIYEGDIASYYGLMVCVKWDDESAMFFIEKAKHGKGEEYNAWAMPKVHNKRDKFEVIGNIYENKELLK